MYRIFYLSWSGRLYQLSSNSWDVGNVTSFPTVQAARDFMREHIVPDPTGENDCADSYIGAVDADGQIITTFPVFTTPANRSDYVVDSQGNVIANNGSNTP